MPLYSTINPRLYHKECGKRMKRSTINNKLFCNSCYIFVTSEEVFEKEGEIIRGR